MLKGIRNERVQSGFNAGDHNDMLVVNEENWNGNEYLEDYIGDMSGQHLERYLVRAARKEEMDKVSEHEVYTKRPIAECVTATGKQPIGSKRIDINKGDKLSPSNRSRLVAKEIERTPRKEAFAATPPPETQKCLFSLAMTEFAKNRAQNFHGTQKLLFVDVRKT